MCGFGSFSFRTAINDRRSIFCGQCLTYLSTTTSVYVDLVHNPPYIRYSIEIYTQSELQQRCPKSNRYSYHRN